MYGGRSSRVASSVIAIIAIQCFVCDGDKLCRRTTRESRATRQHEAVQRYHDSRGEYGDRVPLLCVSALAKRNCNPYIPICVINARPIKYNVHA